MPSAQTSLQRLNAGMQSGWAQSGLQQQQMPLAQLASRTQPVLQKAGPAGCQVGMQQNVPPASQASAGPARPQSMSLPAGWQPQMQQPQKSVSAYPGIRTQGATSPGTTIYEAASAPQNRQPPVTTHYQHPSVPPAGKNAVQNQVVSMPVNPSGSQEFPSTPPPQGSHLVESVVPVAFKPYRCRWSTCYR